MLPKTYQSKEVVKEDLLKYKIKCLINETKCLFGMLMASNTHCSWDHNFFHCGTTTKGAVD